MPDQNAIVDEMIARLRGLQGTSEAPPLTRQVLAGTGLEGGGTLEADVTLALAEEHRTLLAALKAKGLDNLAMKTDLSNFITAAALKPRIFYREFTVGDAPLQPVKAPPIRADKACTITQVTVAIGSPASSTTAVTVAGTTVTVPGSTESATQATAIKLAQGQTIPLTVGATSSANIVVSLRFEEA